MVDKCFLYMYYIVLLIYIILIKSHKRLWLLFFSCANDTTHFIHGRSESNWSPTDAWAPDFFP